MKRLLYRLTERLPCRIIWDNGAPYLERYYVCSIGKTRVYLHRFVGSDPDRGLHSHPWSWAVSLVLSGWYFEERFSGTETPILRRVRWLNILLGESFHRVVMPADRLVHAFGYMPSKYRNRPVPTECWTLFIHRAAEEGRRWGFLRPVRHIGWSGDPLAEFIPYTYPNGATSSGQWWKDAPLGRDAPRRRPAP